MGKRIETFHVAGTSYREDAILSLAEENDDYNLSKKELIDDGMEDERIYKYYFPAMQSKLVPEPDNPHDPNAIKVLVNGVHIGYVKAGSCSHVKNLLASGKVSSYGVDIVGGPYKRVYEDDDGDYQLEKENHNFGATLMITVQDDSPEPEPELKPEPIKEQPVQQKKKSNKLYIIGAIVALILSMNTPILLIVVAVFIYLIIKNKK